ncbi:MAG: M28 family peptidase [Bacteroidia bacterium]|nr:M28 family peptidase [Bacteroidia bacterium]
MRAESGILFNANFASAYMKKCAYRIAGLCMGVLLGGLIACQDDTRTPSKPAESPAIIRAEVAVPVFNADSAFYFTERQVQFGPRVPNTAAHRACATWLINRLKATGAQVITQPATVTAYNGTKLQIQNIIASYNPAQKRRIMLTAHWDTRPVADQDDERQSEPIPGANDGASGVGVLLEIARLLQQQAPTIGVDIILWDGEDYGNSSVEDSYCLGSQYWAANKHALDYVALYAVNLDMVGAAGAFFPREGHSMQYAASTVDKIWKTAERLGYNQYFAAFRSDPIIDDHFYISSKGGIPAVDIIDQPEGRGFFEHWHTHGDDMRTISRETLKAVGQTLLTVVYNEL